MSSAMDPYAAPMAGTPAGHLDPYAPVPVASQPVILSDVSDHSPMPTPKDDPFHFMTSTTGPPGAGARVVPVDMVPAAALYAPGAGPTGKVLAGAGLAPGGEGHASFAPVAQPTPKQPAMGAGFPPRQPSTQMVQPGVTPAGFHSGMYPIQMQSPAPGQQARPLTIQPQYPSSAQVSAAALRTPGVPPSGPSSPDSRGSQHPHHHRGHNSELYAHEQLDGEEFLTTAWVAPQVGLAKEAAKREIYNRGVEPCCGPLRTMDAMGTS